MRYQTDTAATRDDARDLLLRAANATLLPTDDGVAICFAALAILKLAECGGAGRALRIVRAAMEEP